MSDSPFLLGVSRTPSSAPASQPAPAPATSALPPTLDQGLVQAENGVSWGRAASSDMLF